MSAVAERRPPRHGRAPATVAQVTHERQYRLALSALSELTTGGLNGLELRDALRVVTERACEVLAIERGAVYLRDDPREVFVGCCAHPGGELERAVRRLTLGGSMDQITREIVDTRSPLLIRDIRSDPRALTTAVRSWRLRSLLGVPMTLGDQVVGVIMFDNCDELHRYAAVDVEIATAFATAAASAIRLSRETNELRSALETATRQNKLLRRTAMAEHRLSETAMTGGGLAAIVELVSTLTGKSTALYDLKGQSIAGCAPGDEGLPVTLMQEVDDDDSARVVLDGITAGASATIDPTAGAELRRRYLVAPVDVCGDRWGWLVVMEHPSRLVAFDDFLIRRAAIHIALELAGRRQLISASADARAVLARQMIRGTSAPEDLRRSAEYLGVSFDAPRVVAYFNTEPGVVDSAELAQEVGSRIGLDVLATRGPEAVALLVEVPDSETAIAAIRRVKEALSDAFGELLESAPLVGISQVCRTPADLPSGYRVARQVARCIKNFPDGVDQGVLAADDLGPGRLFIANTHPEEARRFVDDVLGKLLDHEEGSIDLVRTLEAFYDTGRSVRLASERLGVHENTVRYRLSRAHSITGLDVAGDPDDQLSVQVALLVLRLQGHPALHSFDPGRDDSTTGPRDSAVPVDSR